MWCDVLVRAAASSKVSGRSTRGICALISLFQTRIVLLQENENLLAQIPLFQTLRPCAMVVKT